MPDRRLCSFTKAALDPEVAGVAAGALAGYGLTKGSPVVSRLSAGAFGATLLGGLGAGLRGKREAPDFANLTEGERAIMEAEAEKLIRRRNLYRVLTGASGVASALLFGSPLPLVAAIPGMTIGPYANESSRLSQLADDFRAARGRN